MKSIIKITYFENKRRVEALEEYREWIATYYANVRLTGPYGLDGPIEDEKAQEVRPRLNNQLNYIKKIVHACGQNFNVAYQETPMRGGRVYRIDALDNLFRIPEMDFDETHILDVLDRSIGEYSNDQKKSLIRTFNPFFWLWEAVEFIVSLPFKLLGKVGFNQDKAEASVVGKILKFIFYLISGLASLLAIFEILGLLDWVKSLLTLK